LPRPRNHGILEGLDHHAQAEPAQVTALSARSGVGGIGLGQFGEIGAAVQLGLEFLGLFLGVHQDVGGVIFLLRGGVLEAGVIGRLQRLASVTAALTTPWITVPDR
jgi:hypothetical protein